MVASAEMHPCLATRTGHKERVHWQGLAPVVLLKRWRQRWQACEAELDDREEVHSTCVIFNGEKWSEKKTE